MYLDGVLHLAPGAIEVLIGGTRLDLIPTDGTAAISVRKMKSGAIVWLPLEVQAGCAARATRGRKRGKHFFCSDAHRFRHIARHGIVGTGLDVCGCCGRIRQQRGHLLRITAIMRSVFRVQPWDAPEKQPQAIRL
jgi:hypothetical protein